MTNSTNIAEVRSRFRSLLTRLHDLPSHNTALLALSLIAVVASVASAANQAVRPPPFQYSAHAYPATPDRVCPGDVITWQPILEVHGTPERPVIPGSTRTIWSIDEQATKVFGEKLTYGIYEEHVTLRPTLPLTVPLTLAPGDYQVRVGRITEGYADASYHVPFTVLNCTGDTK